MKRLIHKNSPIVYGDFSMAIFSISTRRSQEKYSKNHIHPEFEIIWIIMGEFLITMDNKEYLLKENSIFLINSRQTHHIHTVSDVGEYYSISIDDKFVDFDFNKAIFKNNIETTDKAISLIDEIIVEFKKNTIASELTLKSAVCDFLTYLLETKQLELLKFEKKILNLYSIKQIERAIIYINDNYDCELNLINLSAISNFSQSWFSALFRQIVGRSPISYIKSVRLKKALELLEKSEISIEEIAYSVGFSDVNLFSNAFRKQYAVLPQDYRSHVNSELA